jgi:UDP-N-acetylmuramyl pentapeptide phosphotransferase/UDP-N-acetylglucosamine-1-phosphate transferase
MINLILSICTGAACAWLVPRYAYGLGLIDKPNERSSHERPTPKGGGLGILAAFCLVCFFENIDPIFLLSGAVLSMLGLVGDRIEISAKLRLFVQFSVCVLFLFRMGNAPMLNGFPDGLSPYVQIFGLGFLCLYIVGTTNFYNFMDGINGIAAITGIVGFGLVGSYGLHTGQNSGLILIAFAMVFSCAGFLPFNMPRARVFMGDVGSILLGFVFACLVVLFSDSFSDFVILVCFMFPFYVDELVTMLERIIDRQSLTLPHRRHFYQVLVNEGGGAHWKVSVGYGVVQLAVGLLAWFLVQRKLFFGIVGIGLFVIVFFIINMMLKKKFGCWIGEKQGIDPGKMIAKNHMPDIAGINLEHALKTYQWDRLKPMTDDGVTVTGFWDENDDRDLPDGYVMDANSEYLKRVTG